MAQCPKCKEPIGKWQVFKPAFFATRKRMGIDCPKCGAELEVKGSLKPDSSIALIASLVIIIIFEYVQIYCFHSSQYLFAANMILIWLGLINFIYTVAMALVARLELMPEPKKFYDPDRLD